MGYCVFAVAAHPDDIEFGMGGTLIRLAQASCEVHYMNIANGSCGTAEFDAEAIVAIRLEEARNAAESIGAVFHPPLTPDIEIFYERVLLAKMASIMREVAPDILLVQSPQDYMEDHQNACRLAVSAAFCRSMRNFPVDPPRAPIEKPVTLYHAQPHGNRDPLNRLVKPELLIDIGEVIERKMAMLACHKSQKQWLDHSQGFDSYLHTMQDLARQTGEWLTAEKGRKQDRKGVYAEGWRRHNPLGFCTPDADPLSELLGDYRCLPA